VRCGDGEDARKAAPPPQPALFELKNDCRPAGERTAAGRYQEPTLFAKMTRMKALASASVAKSSRNARLSSDPAFERTATSPMQK
jgi:hypothetical protein